MEGIIVLAVFCSLLLAGLATGNLSQRRTCLGLTLADTQFQSTTPNSEILHQRFDKCQVVIGNLILYKILDDDRELTFLNDIEEVTGYLWIFDYGRATLGLRNLRIIHGLELYQNQWAIHVSNCATLRSISATSLAEVSRGAVRFDAPSLPDLCFVDTVPWDDVLNTEAQLVASILLNSTRRDTCAVAGYSCLATCPSGCWTETSCYNASRVPCNNLCGHRCRDVSNSTTSCCHEECAAGCVGPTARDCLACRNYMENGTCVPACSPLTVYSAMLFKQVPNPAGKYVDGLQCVTTCPSHLFIDGQLCVESCSSGSQANGSRCIPCDGICPKTCNGSNSQPNNEFGIVVRYESKAHLETYRNCTHIQGSLHFDGISWLSITEDDLEVLSTVRFIDHYFYFGGSPSNITTLSFLSNLEEIRGAVPYSAGTAQLTAYIVSTKLQDLGLKSFRRALGAPVAIGRSSNLCYVGTLNASYIAPPPSRLISFSNRNHTACTIEGHVCHPACLQEAGCWAAGADQCVRCRYQKVGGSCTLTTNCPRNHYKDGENCLPCHSQCTDGCNGEGADKCTSCKTFRDGPFCVAACPSPLKYPDDSGVCQFCSAVCNGGCTGGKNSSGAGGCNSCYLGELDGTGNPLPTCLNRTRAIDPEEDTSTLCQGSNQYLYRMLSTSAASTKQWYCRTCNGLLSSGICLECGANAYPGTTSCLPCHVECASACSGPGNADCTGGCRNVALNGRCLASCPAGTYLQGLSCDACHSLCALNCTGPSASQCTACRFVTTEESCGECLGSYFYSNETMTCSPCHVECAACELDRCTACHGPTDRDCGRCANFQQEGACVDACSEGYVLNMSSGIECKIIPTTTLEPVPTQTSDNSVVEHTVSAQAVVETIAATTPNQGDRETGQVTQTAEKQTSSPFNWIPVAVSAGVFVVLMVGVTYMFKRRQAMKSKVSPDRLGAGDDSDDDSLHEDEDNQSMITRPRSALRHSRQNSDIMLDVMDTPPNRPKRVGLFQIPLEEIQRSSPDSGVADASNGEVSPRPAESAPSTLNTDADVWNTRSFSVSSQPMFNKRPSSASESVYSSARGQSSAELPGASSNILPHSILKPSSRGTALGDLDEGISVTHLEPSVSPSPSSANRVSVSTPEPDSPNTPSAWGERIPFVTKLRNISVSSGLGENSTAEQGSRRTSWLDRIPFNNIFRSASPETQDTSADNINIVPIDP